MIRSFIVDDSRLALTGSLVRSLSAAGPAGLSTLSWPPTIRVAEQRRAQQPDGEGQEWMEPTPIPERVGFNLSQAGQTRYLQALWERIAEKPGEIPVPESHIELAEERLAGYRREPSRARPARDLLERLANKGR